MTYSHLQKYTYEELLRRTLNAVTKDVDKREGSILRDALSPLCFTAAHLFDVLYNVAMNGHFATAQGEYLDLAGSQLGIYRSVATPAKWVAVISPSNLVSIGQEFVSSSGLNLRYKVIDNQGANNTHLLECLTPGAIGGGDSGNLEASPFVSGLTEARLVSVHDGGRDAESDLDYRIRIWQGLERKGYGGNFYDYKDWIFNRFPTTEKGFNVDGIMIFPAWQGGGTVRIIATRNEENGRGEYAPITTLQATTLQEFLDPVPIDGDGDGVVPIGHRVTVSGVGTSDISLHLRIEGVGALSTQRRLDVIAAIKNAMAGCRKAATTQYSSTFPYNGYSVTLTRDLIVGAVASVFSGDELPTGYSMLDTGGDIVPFDDEHFSYIWDIDPSAPILPYITDLDIEGV